MCIAIVKPKDKVIPKEVLQTCAEANPDGMGFAFCKDKKIYIYKTVDDFEKFYKAYSKVETTSNMLIHFRIATHGEVCKDNCHPFKLNNRMALVHNGIIQGYGSKTDNVSDTRDFIDKVIGNISYKQWWNPSFRELVSKVIGYSKLGILDVTGEYFIINEEKGTWDDGIWYSNSSYKKVEPIKKYADNSTYGYSYNYKKDDYKSIFKCDKCKKEFKIDGYKYYAKCPHCKHATSDNIGYTHKGKDYYYDDDYKDWYEQRYSYSY